ncbi:MAG: lipid A export permease/ATP-binding protein MsbA [Gammaproteobacteria bacterium]|jgi:subfamily B ATP-binding cassette protein MsbA|nr:lipid A export permease/ATP-binding protein MsbA [Gammaproteobacteria bacterium]
MTEARMQTGGLGVYRRLLGYTLRHKQRFSLAILGMVLYAATDTGFAAIIKTMLDGSFVERDPQIMRWAPFGIVAVLLLRGIGGFLSMYNLHYVGRAVIKRLRSEMFDQLLYSPVSYFDRTSSGQQISRITFNTEQVFSAATNGVTLLVRDSLTVLGLLGWMFYLDWRLAIGFFFIAPIVAALVGFASRIFRKVGRGIQDSMGDVSHVAEEMIEGNRVVKIFGGQDYEAAQFEMAIEKNRRMSMRMAATTAINGPVMQIIVGIALAVIISMAMRQSDQVTVGSFVSFIVAMALMMSPVKRLADVNSVLQQGIAAGESIFDLLDSEREEDSTGYPLLHCRGRVSYLDVHFRYAPDQVEVLRGISFEANPGETIALVGRSGSGKSTLANLLPRFYDPTRGEIRVDGTNIGGCGLRNLRATITYVSQDTVLFNDTIERNIAYGQAGAVSRERIMEAAEAAHAREFIDRMPNGLDTLVGENGVLLSGGQRQRLSIARALLKDAPILILDEATSSLDSESERHIQAALSTLLQNRTTLVIAHRLSTVENADRILVLDGGRIVESGRHRALLARNGIYAGLYRLQLHERADAGAAPRGASA